MVNLGGMRSRPDGISRFATYTDEDGRYILEHLPARTHSIKCDHISFRNRLFLEKVEEGETKYADFHFEGATVYGAVYENDKPFGGYMVEISDSIFWEDIHFNFNTGTDAGGNYIITGVPSGSMYLRVRDGRRNPGQYFACVLIEVPESGELQKDIILNLGSISGRVTDDVEDSGVEGVRVLLFNKMTNSRRKKNELFDHHSSMSSYSDEEGRFGFDKIGSGDYLLKASSKELGDVFIDIKLEPGQHHKNIILKIPGSTPSVD